MISLTSTSTGTFCISMLLFDAFQRPIAMNSEAMISLCQSDQPDLEAAYQIATRVLGPTLSSHDYNVSAKSVQIAREGPIYECRVSLFQQFSFTYSPLLYLMTIRPAMDTFDCAGLARAYRLSKREASTLQYLLCGLSTKDIASAMEISSSTVKAFVRLILVKMKVQSRAEIMAKLLHLQAQQ